MKIFVRASSKNSKILVFSAKINHREYEISRLKASEVFEVAVNKMNADWIEFLIDNQYVSKPLPSLVAHPEFQGGCWITMVKNINHEINRIKKFEGNKLDISISHSSATFVCPGVNIQLFSVGGKAGFLIKKANRKIDYWYSGLLCEEFTNKSSLEELKKMAKEAKDGHHFADIPESTLLDQFEEIMGSTWGKRFDRYGVIKLGKNWRWNEGLIFYKSKDVFGIHYNSNSQKSCEQAIVLYEKFKENFQIGLPFFNYKGGALQMVASPIKDQELPLILGAASSTAASSSGKPEIKRNAAGQLVPPPATQSMPESFNVKSSSSSMSSNEGEGVNLYKASRRSLEMNPSDLNGALNNVSIGLTFLPAQSEYWLNAKYLASSIFCKIGEKELQKGEFSKARECFVAGKKHAMEMGCPDHPDVKRRLEICQRKINFCKEQLAPVQYKEPSLEF